VLQVKHGVGVDIIENYLLEALRVARCKRTDTGGTDSANNRQPVKKLRIASEVHSHAESDAPKSA
jgi:putative component of membrane protein insertase Oxa1/YidC/SpoIIIJ protein YidD